MNTSSDSSSFVTQHVATLLDDLTNWRTIANKQSSDTRGTANVQPHAGAWMPADRSFDRILFWRTIENNSFQLFEHSMSHNLLHNAIQIQYTNVLPNIFLVELPDRQQICLMFASHTGVYRWLLKHPIAGVGQLERSQSILADIHESYLLDRTHFYRYDLQLYSQVTCAFTNEHLIFALYNELEMIILRFDNTNDLNAPVQLTFPKRQTAGLLNFFWNPNKSTSSSNQSTTEPLIAGHTTIIYNTLTMTVVLYDTGLIRILSDQLDTILYEHNLAFDLPRTSKTASKMFLDYCQYETFADELITRLFVIVDFNDSLHLFIYEFMYDTTDNFKFNLHLNKSFTKTNPTTTRLTQLPTASSLTTATCTNDTVLLHLLTNQHRPILFLIQYEITTNCREQLIELPFGVNIDDEISPTIDEIEQRLSLPGQFTIDMMKEALWITFNLNLDEYNQSWISISQILQQLPSIMQSLCTEHCEEHSIRNDDCLQILSKFWQNLYSTLIDLRAQALVLLGCRIFDERQLLIVIHKSAVSLYSMKKLTTVSNVKYTRCVKDLGYLLQITDDETLQQIDEEDPLINDQQQQRTIQQLIRIQTHLEPIVNHELFFDALKFIYEKNKTNNEQLANQQHPFASKIGRRLLVLIFVHTCTERSSQIRRLLKLIPLIFRSGDQLSISRQRIDMIQETILPYLQELLQIYDVLLWVSSCGTESPSSTTIDDRDMFIENLVTQQPISTQQQRIRTGNQSLLEQILVDSLQYDHVGSSSDDENWFQTVSDAVDTLFSLLWPNNKFLLTYLSSHHQWTILDRYCGKLDWFKELHASRQFFHALSFYRSATNISTATRYLASVLKELRHDPLLVQIFTRQTSPELFYIEWVREYLKYFGQSQHVAGFLQQALHDSHSNEIRALIISELFRTSIDLKNFDDAFWCIQNTQDFFAQKRFTFQYALAVCDNDEATLSNQQQASFYRLRTLMQYQHDKMGHIDLELLAYLERACVERQPIQISHVYALYDIYKLLQLPLKMAQIMYHYGCSIGDVKEQKLVFELACNALSIDQQSEKLFIYPINSEYNSLAPLRDANHPSTHLVGMDECRQKLALATAIHTLRSNRSTTNIQVSDAMHPTQLSGLLSKFHYHQEAQQLLDAFRMTQSSMYLVR